MRSQRRARWLRIVFALLCGAITTIILAWLAMFLPTGNAWYGPPALEDVGLVQRSDRYKTFQLSRGTNAWHSVVSYWWMQVSGHSLTLMGDEYESREIDLDTLPSHFRPDSVDELIMLSWYHEVGWPFAAMTCSVHWKTQISNSDIIYTVKNGIQLPRDKEFNPRALPFMPLLPGFMLDTLLFSAVWIGLLRLPWVMKRWLRGKRNCCIHCGYSRTGISAHTRCPECGIAPSAAQG